MKRWVGRGERKRERERERKRERERGGFKKEKKRSYLNPLKKL